MNDPIPCSDCTVEYPIELMRATLVGDLCPDCCARFDGAAHKLANLRTPKGIFKEVAEILAMFREYTSVRSDRPEGLYAEPKDAA